MHDGHEWIYVLSGHLRLVLDDRDWVLGPGDVAEFDTRVPHWFGSTGDGAAEILSIFGRPGERMIRTTPQDHDHDHDHDQEQSRQLAGRDATAVNSVLGQECAATLQSSS